MTVRSKSVGIAPPQRGSIGLPRSKVIMWKLRILAVVMITVLGACAPPTPTGQVTIVDDSTIEFPAQVSGRGFADSSMAGYHLIVWDQGGAADHSLFVASVSDVQVLDALENLGARPGNALTIDSWDERNEPDTEAPDRVIEGPRVHIEIILTDGTVLALTDFLTDEGGRGFDMRLGGHRDNIPEWHSGCVVCLYSCPGSKVGNASYTVRDFVAGEAHFQVNENILPLERTEVAVRFRLESETVP